MVDVNQDLLWDNVFSEYQFRVTIFSIDNGLVRPSISHRYCLNEEELNEVVDTLKECRPSLIENEEVKINVFHIVDGIKCQRSSHTIYPIPSE